MRRCKLISPTNLMLEHPILSPVDECEYVLFGAKEYRKLNREAMLLGAIFGGMVAVGFGFVFLAIRILWP